MVAFDCLSSFSISGQVKLTSFEWETECEPNSKPCESSVWISSQVRHSRPRNRLDSPFLEIKEVGRNMLAENPQSCKAGTPLVRKSRKPSSKVITKTLFFFAIVGAAECSNASTRLTPTHSSSLRNFICSANRFGEVTVR